MKPPELHAALEQATRSDAPDELEARLAGASRRGRRATDPADALARTTSRTTETVRDALAAASRSRS